jgi:hypothetical protein
MTLINDPAFTPDEHRLRDGAWKTSKADSEPT